MGPLLAAAAAATATASAVASASTTATVEPTGVVESALTSFAANVLPSAITTTAPATVGVVAVPLPLELAAVFSGAVAGGFLALDSDMDIVGFATVAIVGGLGGGIIRDTIIQGGTVAAFSSGTYLLTALIAALIVFFFAGLVKRLGPALVAIDAVSIGLFAIVGADKALRSELDLLPAILLGAITATGGGMLSEAMVGRVPRLLKPGTFFGFAAVMAATVFVIAVNLMHITKGWAGIVAVALALTIRTLAMHFDWQTRPAADLSPRVVHVARKVRPKKRG